MKLLLALAKRHGVELREGILTKDPTEQLFGVVKQKEEVKS